MSLQIYREGSGAEPSGQQALVVLPNGLQITEEEHEKRLKDVSSVTAVSIIWLKAIPPIFHQNILS